MILLIYSGLLLWIVFRLERVLKTLRAILKSLKRIESALKPPEAARIEFYVEDGEQKRKVDHMNLKISQKLPLSIEIKDRFGNAAAVDGAPKWSVSAPELADLVVAEDGLSAELQPKGLVGSLVVQVHADADLGEGVKDILGELPVELLAGDASVIAIAAGVPVDF